MNFFEHLEQVQEKNNSLVCVGLDVDLEKIPPHILRAKRIGGEKSSSSRFAESDTAHSNNIEKVVFDFNKAIIDATKDIVCAYKPNIAFYEALGIEGLRSLKKTVDYIHSFDIPVIVDAKRNDIGNTATAYAKGIFDFFGFDATTINPYMGEDSVTPFLEYNDKGIIILARTSNPGGNDFQDLICEGKPFFHHIIEKCLEWNKNENVAFVVGATNPEELKIARELAIDSTFLIPGIGAQGGDIEATIRNGIRKDGKGVIINSSRGIIYASNGEDFADAARRETLNLQSEINKYR